MGKRAKPTTIISASLGVAGYLLERGLDMAGVTLSLEWAIVLWAVSGVLILLATVVGFKSYCWPFLKSIRIVRNKVEETAADGSPLDFSVKIESITYKSSIYLDLDLDTQKPPPRLVAEISFRTNKAIQIASLHLEIDPRDPRDIIEPDSDLAQGFLLPHILHRAETHQFQFQLLPEHVNAEHKLHLKVLAGGRWYTDGPYTLNRQG